ncbi:MAG: acetylxylan esterase [Firmicutes bacterium]|nr:acetylxylan esterase [Bacillota bacterium]
MGYIDNIEKELFEYYPPLTKREDFDEFWDSTLKIAKAVPLKPEKKLYDYPSNYVKVYSISYNGFDETRIHGWYILPTFTKESKIPCLIHYHGYDGNKGMPSDFMHWIIMGIAVLSVDCRGQSGETGNCAIYTGGSTQSVVCKGILDKNEYYFRQVYMDCVKAIDFVCAQEEIDRNRIVVEGGSQGGGLTMAVCALDKRPYIAMADVPSNSNIEKRIEGANGAFSSVTEYLRIHPGKVEQVFKTLSYYDTMNMADRIQCKVLASVGLKDNICPAKFYFATYNRIKSEKYIKIYPFNGHEGGGSLHNEVKMQFLRDHLYS